MPDERTLQHLFDTLTPYLQRNGTAAGNLVMDTVCSGIDVNKAIYPGLQFSQSHGIEHHGLNTYTSDVFRLRCASRILISLSCARSSARAKNACFSRNLVVSAEWNTSWVKVFARRVLFDFIPFENHTLRLIPNTQQKKSLSLTGVF